MAIKNNLTKNKISEIHSFAKKLTSAGISYRKLILFGSYAKGDPKPWSDLDICVVSDSFGKNRHSERVLLMGLKDKNSIDVEPHPYNPKDLTNKWDILAQEINKYGVEIK